MSRTQSKNGPMLRRRRYWDALEYLADKYPNVSCRSHTEDEYRGLADPTHVSDRATLARGPDGLMPVWRATFRLRENLNVPSSRISTRRGASISTPLPYSIDLRRHPYARRRLR